MTQTQMPHDLTLRDRKKLTVTGVKQVARFEDTAVVLETELGTLVIQGQQLQLKSLAEEDGQVAVEGTVDALAYQELRSGGWLRRWLG